MSSFKFAPRGTGTVEGAILIKYSTMARHSRYKQKGGDSSGTHMLNVWKKASSISAVQFCNCLARLTIALPFLLGRYYSYVAAAYHSAL